MKKIIQAFAFLLVLFFSFSNCLPISTYGYENYSTKLISKQEQKEFLDKINFKVSDKESQGAPIVCFAISTQGTIALGFDASEDAEINVYGSDGQFLYGYRFVNNHCSFALFFEGEDLSIFWGRERYIGSFDTSGNCLKLLRETNTKSNSDSYHNDRYRPSSGKIGDIQYYAKQGIGISTSYVRFVIENSNGDHSVIYEVGKEYYVRMIALGALGMMFLGLCALLCRKKFDTPHMEDLQE